MRTFWLVEKLNERSSGIFEVYTNARSLIHLPLWSLLFSSPKILGEKFTKLFLFLLFYTFFFFTLPFDSNLLFNTCVPSPKSYGYACCYMILLDWIECVRGNWLWLVVLFLSVCWYMLTEYTIWWILWFCCYA